MEAGLLGRGQLLEQRVAHEGVRELERPAGIPDQVGTAGLGKSTGDLVATGETASKARAFGK